MASAPMGVVFRSALIAGLVASLLVGVFHFIVTEPIIEQSIALEEEMAPPDAMHEEPIVTRDVQRGGLFLGMLIYGFTWAVLLAGVFYLVQSRLPATGLAQRGALLALGGYWALGLFPFLKYPANPPGVGDPETITYRQTLYLLCLGLALVGVALGFVVARLRTTRGGSTASVWLAGLLTVGIWSAVVYVVLPPNPDPVHIPENLLASFRTLSLVGITLFWAVLGLLFSLQLRRGDATRSLRTQVSPAR